MPDYANGLVKVVVFFGVINRVPATTPAHNVFCYSAVARILTPSVNVAFELKLGFKINVGLEPGLGLLFRARTGFRHQNEALLQLLCGFVCSEQQGEIERVHIPPTSTKNILKSLCEVGYANIRPNVFIVGKRISMEILVGVGLHA